MSHAMPCADAGYSRSQASGGMHRLLGSSICVLMLLLKLQASMVWACRVTAHQQDVQCSCLPLSRRCSEHAFHSSCSAFYRCCACVTEIDALPASVPIFFEEGHCMPAHSPAKWAG